MRKLGIENFKIVLIRKVSAADKDALEGEEYKEMDKRSKRRLLNMITVRGNKGNANPLFKRGSISHTKSTSKKGSAIETYRFYWQEWTDGKHTQKSKSFSIKKFGRREAKQKAIDLQDLIYPQ
jgi:hypothetical protein